MGPVDHDVRRWVSTWRDAGDALLRVRADELRSIHTATAIAQLADAFEHALRNAPIRATSGLVEQQRVLQRLRP